jgi:soluble lytic murein transglycosylase-like protein
MDEGLQPVNGSASGLGIRQNGDRRTHDRRSRPRGTADRRLSNRRKKQIGGLLMAAAALAAPQHMRKGPSAWGKSDSSHSRSAPEPNVSVSIDNVRAGNPADEYAKIIDEAAVVYGVPSSLIRAVMQAESSYNPKAVSEVGAQGLMQLMPGLAREMGVTDPFDPRQNIMAGAKYLRKLLDTHSGNIRLALASYNAGPSNVKRYKGIPPFEETRNYVKKITGLLAEEAAADTQD